MLTQSIRISDVVVAGHPARRLVALLAQFDLSALYARYAAYGSPAYEPRQLLALLLYGYMNRIISSRHLEGATYDVIPCIYLMGGAHPDHSTLADFRRLVFTDESNVFAQVLLAAKRDGLFTRGPVSGDGTKIHADASKHTAVSYACAARILDDLRNQLGELQALVLKDDPTALPPGLDVSAELLLRLERIDRLEEAMLVMEERAEARYQHARSVYQEQLTAHETKLAARAAHQERTGKRPRGKKPKPPVPPVPGARPTDQYNFTDPDSPSMKNSTDAGMNQQYNAQVAVDQQSYFIVGCQVSAQPNDMQQAVPTLEAIPPEVSVPSAAAFDAGYRSAANVLALEALGITPFIATGKDTHGLNWQTWSTTHADLAPPADAAPLVRMAYALETAAGDAIYRLRKSTVEPVIGIIKEVLGFRQFSVRGLDLIQHEWRFVCTAYNVKRLLKLMATARPQQAVTQAKTIREQAISTVCSAFMRCRNWQNQLTQRHRDGAIFRYRTPAVIANNKFSRRPWPTGC